MPSVVVLNVYHVGRECNAKTVNRYLQAFGTGAFHGGVEVYGHEFSYGFMNRGTGVFECRPRQCKSHTFWKSQPLGETELSKVEIKQILSKMKKEWRGAEYDLLRRNCCSFCEVFCSYLGVGPLPNWIKNLAAAGATLCDGVLSAATAAQAASIVAAASAGDFDKRYSLSGSASARAEDCIGSCTFRAKENDMMPDFTDFCGVDPRGIWARNADSEDSARCPAHGSPRTPWAGFSEEELRSVPEYDGSCQEAVASEPARPYLFMGSNLSDSSWSWTLWPSWKSREVN